MFWLVLQCLLILLLPLKCEKEKCQNLVFVRYLRRITYLCDQHSVDQIVWYKDQKSLVQSNSRVRINYNKVCHIEIVKALYEDTGKYVCKNKKSQAVLKEFNLIVTGNEVDEEVPPRYRKKIVEIQEHDVDSTRDWQLLVGIIVTAVLLLVFFLLLGVFLYWKRKHSQDNADTGEVVRTERANQNIYVETANLLPINTDSQHRARNEVQPLQKNGGNESNEDATHSTLLDSGANDSDNYVQVNETTQ